MNANIIVRSYQPSDAQALVNIYYHTIHSINSRDYTEEQIHAWAPSSSLEVEGWLKKWASLLPLVAVIDNKIVGFAELEPGGYIDCFYVHHEHQAQGVGSVLINAIEKKVKEGNIPHIYADVSITAKPFFKSQGFHVVKEQEVIIRGCTLKNFKMQKIYRDSSIFIRRLRDRDISEIVEAFIQSHWTLKSKELFDKYLLEQKNNKRIVMVAFDNDQFAGYVTLVWKSQYPFFYENKIPEIMDLNVLPAFRHKGIGKELILTAENIVKEKGDRVGLGVGLYTGKDGGYGMAQKLYIKMGYVPDGKGVTYRYQYVLPGESVHVDDDLVLWLTKSL